MTPRLIILCFLLGVLFAVPSRTQGASVSFTFTLPSPETTSAGAFDRQGALVKTLWNARRYAAGPHRALWDGARDDGSRAPDGRYTIRVLGQNVRYVWDGVIGNTSASFTGSCVWYSNIAPESLAISGSSGFVALGYSEGQVGIKGFDPALPQSPRDVAAIATDTWWDLVATDGQRLYAASGPSGFDQSSATFVAAFDLSGSASPFSSGNVVTLVSPWKTSYPGCIDVAQKVRESPTFNAEFAEAHAATGLAVQRGGRLLAVAHGPLDVVRLFDKETGEQVGNIATRAPGAVAFAPNGDLWVCSGSSVTRFADVGSHNHAAATIHLTGNAAGIAVQPHGDLVLVADAATEQVRAFNHAGAPLWTYGMAGGYGRNGPDVTPDKFQFGPQVPLAVQEEEGSFWVYDAATLRMIHISAQRKYLGQIAWQQRDYITAVDPNQPQRVFAGWLEYAVDYPKPLEPGDPQAPGGNQSWKLVKNWAAGLPTSLLHGEKADDTFAAGLASVVTLTNPASPRERRTFALALDKSRPGVKEILELPATGPARVTGLSLADSSLPWSPGPLYPNGDLRTIVAGQTSATVYRQRLAPFDRDGNPHWGAREPMARVPTGPDSPSRTAGQFPVSSPGVMAFLDTTQGKDANVRFHLGGARLGGTNWLWLASPAVSTDAPPDGLGSYDIGDGTNYGGNRVMAAGRNVLYGYHGEFWNQAEANQFMHFRDDGLFIGQFGTSTDIWRPGGRLLPGVAGNDFTPSLARVNGQLYLWHGEESPHGGIHRWHIVGADAVEDFTGAASISGTAVSSIELTASRKLKQS